jgi:hypothetical protein
MIDFRLEGIGKEFKSKKNNTLALNQIKHNKKSIAKCMLFNICRVANFKTKSTSTSQGLEKIQGFQDSKQFQNTKVPKSRFELAS